MGHRLETSADRSQRNSVALRAVESQSSCGRFSSQDSSYQIEAYPSSRLASTTSRDLDDEPAAFIAAPDALGLGQPQSEVGEMSEACLQ